MHVDAGAIAVDDEELPLRVNVPNALVGTGPQPQQPMPRAALAAAVAVDACNNVLRLSWPLPKPRHRSRLGIEPSPMTYLAHARSCICAVCA